MIGSAVKVKCSTKVSSCDCSELVDVQVFTGNAHPDLAQRIVQRMGKELAKAEVSKFANGETSVMINGKIIQYKNKMQQKKNNKKFFLVLYLNIYIFRVDKRR